MAVNDGDRVSTAKLLETLKGLQASRHLGSEPEVDPQTSEKTKHTIKQDYLPNADWTQNDPDGDGYVQGRTHWVERTETELSAAFNSNMDAYSINQMVLPKGFKTTATSWAPSYNAIPFELVLEGGQIATGYVLSEDENGNQITDIQIAINRSYNGIVLIDYPFLIPDAILVMAFLNGEKAEVTYVIGVTENVHKLDKKFYEYADTDKLQKKIDYKHNKFVYDYNGIGLGVGLTQRGYAFDGTWNIIGILATPSQPHDKAITLGSLKSISSISVYSNICSLINKFAEDVNGIHIVCWGQIIPTCVSYITLGDDSEFSEFFIEGVERGNDGLYELKTSTNGTKFANLKFYTSISSNILYVDDPDNVISTEKVNDEYAISISANIIYDPFFTFFSYPLGSKVWSKLVTPYKRSTIITELCHFEGETKIALRAYDSNSSGSTYNLPLSYNVASGYTGEEVLNLEGFNLLSQLLNGTQYACGVGMCKQTENSAPEMCIFKLTKNGTTLELSATDMSGNDISSIYIESETSYNIKFDMYTT